MSELQNLKVNFLIFQYLPGCEYLRWLFDRHAQIHTKAFGFGGWRMHAYAETMCCRYCKKSGGTPPEKLLREIFRVCMVWNDIVLFSGSPPDRLLSLRSLQLWQCTKKNHDFFFKIKIVWKWNLHTYYIMIIIIGLPKKIKIPDPDLVLKRTIYLHRYNKNCKFWESEPGLTLNHSIWRDLQCLKKYESSGCKFGDRSSESVPMKVSANPQVGRSWITWQ